MAESSCHVILQNLKIFILAMRSKCKINPKYISYFPGNENILEIFLHQYIMIILYCTNPFIPNSKYIVTQVQQHKVNYYYYYLFISYSRVICQEFIKCIQFLSCVQYFYCQKISNVFYQL